MTIRENKKQKKKSKQIKEPQLIEHLISINPKLTAHYTYLPSYYNKPQQYIQSFTTHSN